MIFYAFHKCDVSWWSNNKIGNNNTNSLLNYLFHNYSEFLDEVVEVRVCEKDARRLAKFYGTKKCINHQFFTDCINGWSGNTYFPLLSDFSLQENTCLIVCKKKR